MRTGWTDKSIDELAFVGRGRSRHRPRNDSSLYGGEHPFVQTAEIHDADLWITSYKQTYSDKGLAQSKMWSPGTICITNAGENTGDCAILGIPACFPDSIIAVIADESKSDPIFLKYVIDQLKPRLRRITRGATQDNLSVEKLTSFKFPTPKIE
jgi:type I restriction enzyme S subunit